MCACVVYLLSQREFRLPNTYVPQMVSFTQNLLIRLLEVTITISRNSLKKHNLSHLTRVILLCVQFKSNYVGRNLPSTVMVVGAKEDSSKLPYPLGFITLN